MTLTEVQNKPQLQCDVVALIRYRAENVTKVCLPLFQARCALLSLMAKNMTTTRRQNIRNVTRLTSKELPPFFIRLSGSLKLPGSGHHAIC